MYVRQPCGTASLSPTLKNKLNACIHTEMQKKLRMQILYNGLPRFLMDYYVLIYTQHWGADEVSG